MKNKYLVTTIVAAVFLLSLLSPLTAAQKPADKGQHTGDAGSGDPHEKLVKFQSTGKAFDDAKQQFENSLKQFNANKNSKSKGELIEKGKGYLGSAIDRIDAYLDVLKSRAENPENQGVFPFDVSKNADAHVAELEQLRTKVETDNTTDELRADNQELKDEYSKIRLETRYGFEILLNNRISSFIGKAENVTSRMNAAIQNLNSQGKDTSNLEAIAANFTNLMQEASADQQKTEALLATHTGFDDSGKVINNTDAQAFLIQVDNSQRDTIKILRAAVRQVQEFVRDYRKLSNGRALVMGTGTLTANGSGRAVIVGNVTVTLSGNDTLVVSNNAVVTTDGGTNQTLGNGQVQYQGFNSATITGDNIRVGISGNNINLTASGTGAAVLNGNGTYRTENNFSVSGEWTKE